MATAPNENTKAKALPRSYEVVEVRLRYRFGLYLTGPCVGGYAPYTGKRGDPHAQYADRARADAAGRYFVLTGVTPANQPDDIVSALAQIERVAA